MHIHHLDSTARDALIARRAAALEALGGRPALLAAGRNRPRAFAAEPYAFRAASHFLYLVGASIEGAALLLADGEARLFVRAPAADDALWHGPEPTLEELGEHLGLPVSPLSELGGRIGAEVMTLPTPDLKGCAQQAALLGRPIAPGRLGAEDEALAEAMIAARLRLDDYALKEMGAAIEAATAAFEAGMRATRPGRREWVVRAQMTAAVQARGMELSFGPIVSTHGEVLHNPHSHRAMEEGALLLVDFGAESRGGVACDVTRTWPVSGRFSATQRDLYDVVLAARTAAVEAVAPGARYLDVHLTAARVLTQGLVDLGILVGEVDGLVEDGVHALFFPHGVGHLLGYDVHDMEDLGDRAGYAPGRARSEQFGLGYLRLDRDLAPGMVVTIEPGFYQVPALLEDAEAVVPASRGRVDRERLAAFADVRGIRIEDDVRVTEEGREVLTAAIPREATAVEAVVRAST